MKFRINAILSELTDRKIWTKLHEQILRLRYGIGDVDETGGLNWGQVVNRINQRRNKVKIDFVQKLHGEAVEVLRPYLEIESMDKSFLGFHPSYKYDDREVLSLLFAA